MDWQALTLSLKLAVATAALLLPFGIVVARTLAWRRFPGRRMETLVKKAISGGCEGVLHV